MSEELFIVDRIEEKKIAVCERQSDEVMVEIPVKKLPKGVRTGDFLSFRDGVYTQEPELRRERERLVLELEREVFGK